MKEMYEPTTGDWSVLLRIQHPAKVVYHAWSDDWDEKTKCGIKSRFSIVYRLLDPERARPCKRCFKPKVSQ